MSSPTDSPEKGQLLPAFEPVAVPPRSSSSKPRDPSIKVHRLLFPIFRDASLCFCGSSLPSNSETIYCSTCCARENALTALVAPSTSPDKIFPSPPTTPESKRKEQKIDLTDIGASLTEICESHYRRMEALGMYDSEAPPTPTLTRTTRADSVASSVLASPQQAEFPEQKRTLYFDCFFNFQASPPRKVIDPEFPLSPTSTLSI